MWLSIEKMNRIEAVGKKPAVFLLDKIHKDT